MMKLLKFFSFDVLSCGINFIHLVFYVFSLVVYLLWKVFLVIQSFYRTNTARKTGTTLREHKGAHRNIVLTVIAVIALASYVILFSSVIIPVSGQGEFNTLRISSVNPPIDIQGGDSVNIARNLASFQDSSFT